MLYQAKNWYTHGSSNERSDRSVKGKSNLLDINDMNKKTNTGCVVRQRAVIEGPGWNLINVTYSISVT